MGSSSAFSKLYFDQNTISACLIRPLCLKISSTEGFNRRERKMGANASEIADQLKADSAEKRVEPSELNPPAISEDLNALHGVEERLSGIKKNLNDLVDSFAIQKSWISRLAITWGKLPLWLKIIGGIAFTVPVLVAGVFAHLGFVLVMGGVAAFTYSAGGLVLDNHYLSFAGFEKKLKQGILSLGNMLGAVISALDSIRLGITKQVEKFTAENQKLESNVEEFKNENVDLKASIDKLNHLKENMAENFGSIIDGLKGTVQHMSHLAISDEQTKVQFNLQLKDMIEKGNINFHQYSLKIKELENEIHDVKNQLKKCSEDYAQLNEINSQLVTQRKLLNEQNTELNRLSSQLVTRLEGSVQKIESMEKNKIEVDKANVIHCLKNHGVFAQEAIQPPVSIEESGQKVVVK